MSTDMIKIFTTGGTIDKIYFDAKSEFQVGDPEIVNVLQQANVVVEYAVESILRKDSLELTSENRRLIRSKIELEASSKILVTHGTDSMIETANQLHGIEGKTIVLTGSMHPAKFRVSDAVFNIGCALTAVQLLGPGVYIAMNGRIFDPQKSQKNVAQNRFEKLITD